MNERWRWISALALAAALVVAALGLRPAQATLVRNPSSHLDTWEVGAGKAPLILLHGYASTPQEWLPFSHTILIHPDRRFVFPGRLKRPRRRTARRARARGGGSTSRRIARGTRCPTSRARGRKGLSTAAEKVRLLIGDLQHRETFPADRVMLGGFSQGGMIAAEVAFRTAQPLEALILLSPTFVDEQRWIEGMSARKGLPVFISHGRRDDVLPFAASERMAQAMRQAGMTVTWVPFEGVHETPALVVTELNKFLAAVEPGK